ncbi:hypothetical protein PO883_27640 [Massilia sp. DJPM01]|nr:hypothetical protein [Massilia sp. DJPM01]MDM5180960.1 hypothetical protein [Massilia sp. DJPM01]
MTQDLLELRDYNFLVGCGSGTAHAVSPEYGYGWINHMDSRGS